ncbi:MAG: endonuclease V [Deltaproteobacteria bacterium]|nr:endonuclease V [Deltaproteobacteria bacterium]
MDTDRGGGKFTGRRAAPLHGWAVTPREALAIQRGLAPKIVVAPPVGSLRTVAGLDVSVGRFEKTCRAGAVLLEIDTLRVLARVRVTRPVPFPYVPGLLSFREIPVLLDALAGLPSVPDVLVVDGQGYAHPRRFGLACHLGLWCGIPSIGVAKSILCGVHGPLGPARGSVAPLVHGGETVGVALRTRAGVKPVYVSVGHRFDLDSAVSLVLRLAVLRRGSGQARFRLVEPVRQAHALVSTRGT